MRMRRAMMGVVEIVNGREETHVMTTVEEHCERLDSIAFSRFLWHRYHDIQRCFV